VERRVGGRADNVSENKLPRADRKKARRQRKIRLKEEGAWYPKWYWPKFAIPGIAWLAVLFILPFYAVFAITFGYVNPLSQVTVPVWQPWYWDTTAFKEIAGRVVGKGVPNYAPFFIRTFVYVAIASFMCVVIAYPVAYFVARYGGRRKGLYLMLLIAPFWVSYLMRMLAWGNLLTNDGYVNKILVNLHILSQPYPWLDGKSITVVSGLIYGYIPYMILPLYAGLDRISQSLLEASRDLGANTVRTFIKVTLPLSKQAIIAGMVIVTLPMFGDYYTTALMSGYNNTKMIGSLIDDNLNNNRTGEAATLVLILVVLLIIPMLWYLRSTNSETART